MKKFYQKAEAGTAPGGFVVRLDGKLLKTPMQHALLLSSMAMAAKVADEWNGQGAVIIPASMPLTQMANTMLDKSSGHDRQEMEKEIVRYSGSDLVCYFATHPVDLIALQEKHWLPLLAWLEKEHGIRLEKISGIRYHHQPEESVRSFAKMVSGLSPRDFTVVQAVLGVTGSVVIALALLQDRIDAEEAYQAACVDEIYQLEKWGEDALARKKLDHKKAELESIVLFKDLI
jgi:chaperone required for assembly of F1-ATPase